MKLPLVVFCLLLWQACTTHAQQPYLFTEIAASSGGYLLSFYPPSINQAGVVALHATTSNTDMVLEGDGLSLFYLADSSFSGIFPVPGIADDGTVAFLGGKYDGTTGIFTSDGTSSPKLLVGPSTYGGFRGDIAYNSQNVVAFWGSKKTPSEYGIYAGNSSAIYTIASNATGFSNINDSPTINANGTVGFRATPTGGTLGSYLGDGNTTTRLDFQASSGVTIGTAPSVNTNNTLAFLANGADGTIGVYRAASPSAKAQALLTLTNSPYISLGPVCINQSGQVAYYYQTTDHVFRIVTNLNAPVTVLARGDTLFGSVVSDLRLSPSALNDSGQVAFAYTLQDGRSGVVRANPSQTGNLAPVVTTGTSDTVQTGSATLHAQVNPSGTTTNAFFYYGTTVKYGAATRVQTLPAGANAVDVATTLTGLTPGTLYHYRLVATNASGTTYASEGTFTTLTYAQSWRQQYFGSPANSGNGADGADPDGDGVSNLLERALGMNPTVADATKLPVVTRSASTGRLTISASKGAQSGDLTFSAEVSADLLNWSSANTTVTTNTATQFSAYDSGPTGTRRFIRLRVTGSQ